MSKIEFVDVKGGYNLSSINTNFDRIKEVIDEDMLSRANSGDEPNEMKQDLDMNGNHIYNLPPPYLDHEPVRLKEFRDKGVFPFSYFGPLEDEPSSRPDGSQLQEGDSYYDIQLQLIRYWNGSSWFTPNIDGQQLQQSDGSKHVGYKYPDANSVATTVFDRLDDLVFAEDFGAVGDGVTNDTSALQNMATRKGYIVLGARQYLVSSTTFNVPVYFNSGASLFIPSGETVIFTEKINAPREWILQGDGAVYLNIADNKGEDSKHIHCSWFGVFPSGDLGTDITTRLQRAANCFSNQGREGTLHLDNGRYHLFGTITLYRGTRLVGAGSRRTVFIPHGTDYTVFELSAVAIKVEGIQFEYPVDAPAARTEAYIHIAADDCDIEDVRLFPSSQGIVIDGLNCQIKNIRATYGVAMGADSSMIWVRRGNCFIDGVFQGSSAFGPSYLVRIGNASGSTVSSVIVKNLQIVNPSIPVFIDATLASITRIQVDNVVYNGSLGSIPEIIRVEASGAFACSNIQLNTIIGTTAATNGITIVRAGTGTTENISIDKLNLQGSSGYGIGLTQTGGMLRNIKVGSEVFFGTTILPISVVGTVTGFVVSSGALPNTNAPTSYLYSIPTDTAVRIALNRNVFTSVGILSCANTEWGQYVVRAAPTPAITPMFASSTNVNHTTGVLTGTTGTSGKVTISADAGAIYLENRLGSTQNVHFTLLSGA